MRYRKDATGRKNRDGFRTSSHTPEDAYVACVAVKMEGNSIQVRDTKDATDTTLSFTAREWDAFIKGVKGGEFDL